MSLVIVPTPVGNLEDITIRAIKVLRSADLIACEDTRKTSILLKRYSITTKMISYHAFNEKARTPVILAKIMDGARVALVSDAGTPGISDPGAIIIKEAISLGIQVEVLPGPTAFVPALVSSGIPAAKFIFGGFLPDKEGPRKKYLKELLSPGFVTLFYISPHKAYRHISDILDESGNVEASLSREISKFHHETIRGPLSEILEKIEAEGIRGELVLVVSEPEIHDDNSWLEEAETLFREEMTIKDIVNTIINKYNVRKNEVKNYLTSLERKDSI